MRRIGFFHASNEIRCIHLVVWGITAWLVCFAFSWDELGYNYGGNADLGSVFLLSFLLTGLSFLFIFIAAPQVLVLFGMWYLPFWGNINFGALGWMMGWVIVVVNIIMYLRLFKEM